MYQVENEDVGRAAPTGDAPNYTWVINNLIAHKGATYITDLTVYHIKSAYTFIALVLWLYKEGF